MKKKSVVFVCSLMAVMSLVACGKKTSPEKEWTGAYVNKNGMMLILCEDGDGYLNEGYRSNDKIEWEIDDDEIEFKTKSGEKYTIDIEDKEPGDKITVKSKSSKTSEKFERVEIYEED
ncbi:hypothetical protein SAMN02745229_00070 [Butyrivibrio fibrisolvens DSM 3071]|jgi:hypothetical protein|uniref:DUF5640 domain-containing protein n=1 Tax=Butyrivibrio fibrisolvens DSM 3071 TaxID=1121131 RepID=A0A1M5PR67_BUTFI|nr:hypothetical protein [Butyrivibrio fibrisolvens]SHH04221.1 hypothetical protein SAMN02745229_00070 [Butyrivibrio fibrisolvens DSM 3071]